MIDSVFRLKNVSPGFDTATSLPPAQLPEGGKYVERLPGDMEKSTVSVDEFYRQLLLNIPRFPE